VVAEKYLKDPSFRPKNGFGWAPLMYMLSLVVGGGGQWEREMSY
jgi:hypothetical protein